MYTVSVNIFSGQQSKTAAVGEEGEAGLKSDLLKISQITALCIHSYQRRRHIKFISSNNAKSKTQRNGILGAPNEEGRSGNSETQVRCGCMAAVETKQLTIK